MLAACLLHATRIGTATCVVYLSYASLETGLVRDMQYMPYIPQIQSVARARGGNQLAIFTGNWSRW